MSKKLDKELKQEQQIAQSLATVIEARASIESLVRQYDTWIDESAELGEEDYSDQLIQDQVDLEDFARNLSFIEVRIRESAVSARAFGKLKCLPGAMACCKALSSGLNLPKLGKQMTEFKESLDKARASLKDLRSEMSSNKDYEDLFGKQARYDEKTAQAIANKKAAREARLARKLEASAVAPVPSGVGMDNFADIEAINAMIDAENNKK